MSDLTLRNIPDSIADALATNDLYSPNYHTLPGLSRGPLHRVTVMTALSIEDINQCLGHLQRVGSAGEGFECDVARTALFMQRKWDASLDVLRAFIHWLTVTPALRDQTDPWDIREGGVVLEAVFRKNPAPKAADAIRFLQCVDPYIRTGRELPSLWNGMFDVRVTSYGIEVEDPTRDLFWRRFHPCTPDLARKIIVQRGFYGVGDAQRFLSRVNLMTLEDVFRPQAASNPVRGTGSPAKAAATLYALSEKADTSLALRRPVGGTGRWECHLHDSTVLGTGGLPWVPKGTGETPEEAMADYLDKIRGKTLVVRGESHKRLEITVPTHPTV